MELVERFNDEGFHYKYNKIQNKYDLTKFLYKEAKKVLTNQIQNLFKKYVGSSWKYHFEVQIKFDKLVEGEIVRELSSEPWFTTTSVTAFYENQIEDLLLSSFQEIESRFDCYVQMGSGWIFSKVIALKLTLAQFYPCSGGINPAKKILPDLVSRKKGACVNLKSDKNRCFIQCITAYCLRNNIEQDIDTSNLTFPTPLSQILLFEKRNGFSINVFGWVENDARLCVFYLSKVKSKHCIDLLLWKEHYYLIADLSKLIGKRWHKSMGKKYVCRSCLCYYSSTQRLQIHTRFCDKQGQVYTYPVKGKNKLQFTNYNAMIENDHVIYYDFECMLCKNAEPDDRIVHTHVPIAVGAIRICVNPTHNSKLFTYVGRDCVSVFLDWLDDQRLKVRDIVLNCYQPLKMTKDDWKHFSRQKCCEMCGVKFDEFTLKFKDHIHLTSRFRFTLCNTCNFTHAKRDTLISVLAHSGTFYDTHLLINELAKRSSIQSGQCRLTIIPKNREHYLSIRYGCFVFLDSYQFLSNSLSDLADSNKLNDFPMLRQYVKNSEEKLQLLSRKGVMCYEFLDCEKKLALTELPSKDDFFDSLTNQAITDEQYDHALKVWDVMNCKTLKDYLLVYLASDVLILTDIFQAFRSITMKNFTLDPTKFMSMPHLSFHAMLRFTGVKLDLMVCPDMVNFITGSIRGGVSSIVNKYAKANFPGLPDYNPEQPISEIAYFDCTSMYAFALSRYLPLKNFHFLPNKEVQNFDVTTISTTGQYGYILEVDIKYGSHLHDQDNELPLLPDRLAIPPSLWSNYMHELAIDTGMEVRMGTPKLIPHLGPRKHYVVHYLHLQFCVSHGLEIERIHRILAFEQARWMKPWVDNNAHNRKMSKSKLERDCHKFSTNSIYGKCLENPHNRVNLQLVTNSKAFHKLSRKPNFNGLTIYNSRLAGIEMKKPRVMLNKPFAVGFTVLELSKLHLYKFHYDYVKKLYGNDSKLLFCDTDSVSYDITNHNVNQDMYVNKKYFDLSNFNPESPFHWTGNCKIPGTYKREHANDKIISYVGLKPKVYSLQFASDICEKRAKGLKKSVLKTITHRNFFETLMSPMAEEKVSYLSIRSKKHKLVTVKESRKSLSAFDDKRYFLSPYHSLAYNHYSLG